MFYWRRLDEFGIISRLPFTKFRHVAPTLPLIQERFRFVLERSVVMNGLKKESYISFVP